MHVIEDVRITEANFENIAVTIGCFDGIHLGHQQIIQTLRAEAGSMNGIAAVMTLEPNPRLFFSPQHAPNILTPPAYKQKLLEDMGVSVLYVLPFDAVTASMSPKQFIEDILVKRCRAKVVIVGHDFAFGHKASGDYALLKELAPAYGFHARQVAPLIIGGQRVSSTLIRERVVQGEVEDLEMFLGRKFALVGTVIPGCGIGRVLGFPTANINVGMCAVPAHGVYAAETQVDGRRYLAAVNIGIAPTIRGTQQLVEAHLLGFNGNLVGRELELSFHKHLRPEKKFASRDELIEAIKSDVNSVRTLLS